NGKPACNLSKVIQYTSSTVSTGKTIKGTVFEELFISKEAVVSLYKQTASGDKYELYSLHKTDASGNYLFTQLPVGKYMVLAEKNGNPRFVPTWFGNVTLSEDADRIVLDDRDRHSNRLFDIHLQQMHLSDPLDMTTSSTRVDTGGAYVTLVDRYNNVVGTFKTDINGNLLRGQTEIPPGSYKVINPVTSKESSIEIGSGNSGTIDHYSDLITDKTSDDEPKSLMPADPLVIMPNPAVSDIRFEVKLDTYQQVQVRIVNANGIEVYNQTTFGEPGANKFNIVISSFKPGVYYVMVKKGQGVPVISQLIKAN
ncbi:MAG: T9SS type A sorting domain-containing protein, partial [Bacteroidia bacterium]|nr:T9SS type A sorting domain-containing protein [Bacteroidia bacterium]